MLFCFGMPPGYLRHPHVCKICFFFLFCNRWHPANLSGAVGSLMAVINSVGVGRGSKSVGEFTYRYTRGRTIASRRITRNTSKTPAQVGRRGAFGSFVWMFSPYKWFFSDGYEKTKHGSSFNQFVHVNRELLGKSPYNSEVNKKLIPNGAQLWKLIDTISKPNLLHLKYATFGTLDAVVEASSATQHYSFTSVDIQIFTEDFKGLSVTINTVTNRGETFSKEIPLYENSENPNFSVSYEWFNNSVLKIETSIESGIISMKFEQAAVPIFAMGLTQKPVGNNIETYSSIVIKQYRKIVSLQKFHYANITASVEEEELSEESSGTIHEDNTEIK